MPVLSNIRTVLKNIAEWLRIKPKTGQPPASSPKSPKHSKSWEHVPSHQDGTTPNKTQSNVSSLDGRDNHTNAADHQVRLDEERDTSESTNDDSRFTVTQTDLEVDSIDPVDPRLITVSTDSDDNSNSPSNPDELEPSSLGEYIQLLDVHNEGNPSIPGKNLDINDPDDNAELKQSPEVPPEQQKQPRKIAGRRTRVLQKSSNEPREDRVPHPQLICYKKRNGGTWEVALSVDEDLEIESVYLQGRKLDTANHEHRIPIPSLRGQLTVKYQDGHTENVTLFEGNPLIFKLQLNWRGNGRKIGTITRGYFIVFAPTSWNRTGNIRVAPEGCTDSSFLAHYFYQESKSQDDYVSGFQESGDFRTTTGINLSGQIVFDDSEEGDLFVQREPELIPSKDIVWARVGREANYGWKGQNFKPDDQTLSEILNGREGRFFLRVYDSSIQLLDSTEFRFVRGLKEIRVNGESYTKHTILLPDLSGHPPMKVQFVGINDSNSSQITICEGTHTVVKSGILAIDRSKEANSISCILGSENNQVTIKLDLPRTWWKMVCGDEIQSDWRDTPLTMTRQEFREHAYRGSEIRLLQKRLESIQVGFDHELDQEFKHSEGKFTIPLNNFVDYVQIDQRLTTNAHLKVELVDTLLHLIVISADPLPSIESFTASPKRILKGEEATLRWVTSEANEAQVTITPGIGCVKTEGHRIVHPTETTVYTLSLVVSDSYRVDQRLTINVDFTRKLAKHLQPLARHHDGSGWKNAKGFSHDEVQCAGLTIRDAYRRSLCLDSRRRTVHQINVQALKTFLNE